MLLVECMGQLGFWAKPVRVNLVRHHRKVFKKSDSWTLDADNVHSKPEFGNNLAASNPKQTQQQQRQRQRHCSSNIKTNNSSSKYELVSDDNKARPVSNYKESPWTWLGFWQSTTCGSAGLVSDSGFGLV